MVVAGASRHAKEVIQILTQFNESILLFDDFSKTLDNYFGEYTWIKETNNKLLLDEKNFVIAIGGTRVRELIAQKLITSGLTLNSLISNTAEIGTKHVHLGNGVNIMNFVFISDCVSIGEGTLINAFASIHHDVNVGKYCDISPRATLLGGVQIDDFTWIGAGTTILPNIKIGKNCTIGAGSLVTKDIPDNCKAYGVPAKIIHE